MIKDRISNVRENIARVCQRIGRNPDDITLVGVTKYTSAENTLAAIEAGITDIGELKVQDAQEKFLELEKIGVSPNFFKKHMIGHLQTNKVKTAIQIFDLIQTVDSFKLASEIDRQALSAGKVVSTLIEVNSGEEQKFGVPPTQVLPLLEKIAELKNIEVLGLMTMAPLTQDEEITRRSFRELFNLSQKAGKDFEGHPRIQMKYLSMGMTGDYEIALEEGANMVRIGSAIFKED